MQRLLMALLVAAGIISAGQSAPFTAKDWSTLRSARATAVSSDGQILYHVTFGAEKGPTRSEWWTIAADGGGAAKLDLSDDFSPFGFSADGKSLYGRWKVNNQQQLAIFPITDHKASSVPATVILLPRGIDSASASPDGKRFAIVADPRPVDPLEDVRHVIDAGESSLYVVNADGTAGRWWCADLKSISSETAWSADSSSLALLSVLPHIGYHKASSAIDVCGASAAKARHRFA